MKSIFNHSRFSSLLLLPAACFTILAAEPAAPPSPQMAIEDSLLITITASVEAINPSTREVTLKGPLGNEATLTVDQKVKRFNEIKTGDMVRAEYYVALAAEVRAPTPDEELGRVQMLEAAGKAPSGSSPAAGGLRRFKVVATIEGLDRPTRTITVKGPLGRLVTARVREPERLTQLRIVDPIVITYTEALAISLEKVN
jgi:hypothetical protein